MFRGGVTVEVIMPAFVSGPSVMLAPWNTVPFGNAKLAWLKRLKTSARNCNRPASPRNFSGVSLTTEKFVLEIWGPLRKLRDELPRKPAGWTLNAQGSNHRVGVPRGVPAAITFVPAAPVPQPDEVPLMMLLMLRVGSIFGRSGLVESTPDSERFRLRSRVYGYPVCHPTILLTHQPFKSPPTKRPEETFGK